jgi:hypothetical protein
MDHDEFLIHSAAQVFRFRTRYAYRIPEGNDFTEMLAMEDMRRDGLTPARRVEINTDAYEFQARQDRYEE